MLYALPAGKPVSTLEPVHGFKPHDFFARLKVANLSGNPVFANGQAPVFTVPGFGKPLAMPETLAPVSGHKPETFGLSLFPNLYPWVSEVPSSTMADDAEPFAMGPASHWCNDCCLETVPVPLSDPAQGWILFPCHDSECSCCYEVGEVCDNCEKVSHCCDCLYCGYGDHKVKETCEYCDYCSDHCCCSFCSCGDLSECGDCEQCDAHCTCYKRCQCADCQNRASRSYGTAPWIKRNDPMPTEASEDVARWIREESRAMGLDPVQSMADFYLCDYVSTVLTMAFPTLANVRNANNGLANAASLKASAENFQRHIVRRADTLFQEYTFAAIGGEVRHHGAISGSIPGGRESCWDYWHAMGETIGRETLTQDCVDLFGDGSWDSGYGGYAWETIARTLLGRLTGHLDARTFVDRVFSLQHNGGSLLDKVSWASLTPNGWGVEYCRNIGNAHAAARIDFSTLLDNASHEVVAMVRTLVVSFGPWMPGRNNDDYYTSDYKRIMESLPNVSDTDNEEEDY